MVDRHRKEVRHFEQTRHLQELTFSCFRRKPLLTSDCWRGLLAAALDQACVEEGFQWITFVFMPEHVHRLVLPQDSQSRISRLLAGTKQPVSKQIREILEARRSPLLQELMVQERPGKRCFRFWQEGAGFDRNLFSPQAITASIEYIHMNPVQRGLCQRATDFKWSSARFDLRHIVDPDLPNLTRPGAEWFQTSGIQVDPA